MIRFAVWINFVLHWIVFKRFGTIKCVLVPHLYILRTAEFVVGRFLAMIRFAVWINVVLHWIVFKRVGTIKCVLVPHLHILRTAEFVLGRF
jgi:hypothetical protein